MESVIENIENVVIVEIKKKRGRPLKGMEKPKVENPEPKKDALQQLGDIRLMEVIIAAQLTQNMLKNIGGFIIGNLIPVAFVALR